MGNKRVNINIPAAHFHSVLSWDKDTIDRLVSDAVDLVCKIGLQLYDDDRGIYLKEAESKNASIDWNCRAVNFTRCQVQETIEIMRQTRPVPDPLRPMVLSEKGRDERFFVGNGANLVFDWDSWQATAPAACDIVEISQWVQGFDDLEAMLQPVMLKDIDPRLEPLYSYALMCKYCRKRVYHNQPTEPVHVRYLDKMSGVVEKHRDYCQPMQDWEYINPPFRMGRRAIATMLERVDSGICNVIGVGSMAVAGMSAPVTAAGTAITALAEILSGLTFFRIMRPGLGLKPNICAGSLDLRSGRVSFFSMHTHLCNLATWDLLVRGIGVDSPISSGYRDANEPGLQALYEVGIAQNFFSTVAQRCCPEIGGLACGNIFSPHQAVMDIEVIKEFNELAYGFEVSDKVLGTGEIIKARFEQAMHMSSEHTLNHMKNGVSFSDFLFRGLPAGAQHDKNHTQTEELMKKAAQSVETAMASGRQVKPDVDLGKELHEFVKEAAAELGIEAPPLT